MGKEESRSVRSDKHYSKRENQEDYNRHHQGHTSSFYPKTIRPKSNTKHNNTNNQFIELKNLLVNKDQKISNLENEINEIRRSRYNLTYDDRKDKYGYTSKFLTKRPGSSVKFRLHDLSNVESPNYSDDDNNKEEQDINNQKVLDNITRSCNISPKAKSKTESLRTETSLATTNSTQVHRNNAFFKVVIVPFLQKIIKQFTSSLVFKTKATEIYQRFIEMMDVDFNDYNKFNLLHDILEDFSFLHMQHIGLLNKEIQYEKASQVMIQKYNTNNNLNKSFSRGNFENYDNQDRTIPRTSDNVLNSQYGYQYMETPNLQNRVFCTNNIQREPYNYSPSRKSFIPQNHQSYDFPYSNQYDLNQTTSSTAADILQRDNILNNINRSRLDHTCDDVYSNTPPQMVSIRNARDNIPSPIEKRFNKFNLKHNNSKNPPHSHMSQSNVPYNLNKENM